MSSPLPVGCSVLLLAINGRAHAVAYQVKAVRAPADGPELDVKLVRIVPLLSDGSLGEPIPWTKELRGEVAVAIARVELTDAQQEVAHG